MMDGYLLHWNHVMMSVVNQTVLYYKMVKGRWDLYLAGIFLESLLKNKAQ